MIGQYPGDRSGAYFETTAYLAGTPTYTGFNRAWQVSARDASTENTVLHLDSGDSIAVELFQDWSYGIPTGLTRGLWEIESTGGGDLTVETGFDFGWSYPSYTTTWTASNLAAIGGDSNYYAYPSDELDADHLYDTGAPLLKITCTSGAVDITWIGMRIEQPQGLFLADGGFEWSSSFAPTTVKGGGYGTYDYYLVGSDSFWTVDDTEVMAIEPQTFTQGDGNYFDPVNIGADGALAAIDDALAHMVTSAGSGPSVTATFNASPNGGFGFFPPGWSWHASITEHNAQWTSPTRCAPLAYPDGYFALEGWYAIDYQWLGDDWGFLGWVLFDTLEGTSDECTWALRQFVIADGAYGAYTLHAGSASASGSTAPTTTEIASYPPDVLDDPGTVPLSYAEVTTSDRLYYMSMTVVPTVPGTSAGEVRATRISDSTDITVSPVRALFRVPGYQLKMPTFEAAPYITFTGLKVRMPDNTWRRVGDEGLATPGRIKIQSEDLTWWQEYRTGDGDVPVHPLKLYTAEGWLVVARMTPD
jgi:hypothetical protein